MGIVKRDLENKDVQVIFRKLSNERNPTNDLMINMLGSFAQFERELIADRTRRGKRYKAEIRKLIVGNIPPYGFQYIYKDREKRIDGRYIINQNEAETVKKMFELVDREHYSARSLVKWLTNEKISPRKGNTKWARSTVLRILRRSEYIGIAYYNKFQRVEPKEQKGEKKYRRQKKSGLRMRSKNEWIEIPIPECAIIPKDRFLRVQQIISQNRAFSKRNTKYEYLMAKLMECACGSPVYGCPMHSRRFYRCGNKERSFPLPPTCKPKLVSATILDATVWNTMVGVIQRPEVIMQGLKHYPKAYANEIERDTADRTSLERVIKNLEEQGGRVFDAYKLGAISLEKYQEEMKGIVTKKAEHAKKHEQDVEPQKQCISPQVLQENISLFCELLKRGLQRIENNFEKRQRLVRLLIEKAVLDPTKRTLDIGFRFPIIEEISQETFESCIANTSS